VRALLPEAARTPPVTRELMLGTERVGLRAHQLVPKGARVQSPARGVVPTPLSLAAATL
jgi:hypothetical protein